MTTWNTGAQPVVLVDPATGESSTDWAEERIFYCSFSIASVAPAATVMQIVGVSGKRVRLCSVGFDGSATPSSRGFDFELSVRSAVATGGTPEATTLVPQVPGTTLPAITVTAYSASPTPGAFVSFFAQNLMSMPLSTSTAFFSVNENVWVFGDSGPVFTSESDILTLDVQNTNTSTIAPLIINLVFKELP